MARCLLHTPLPCRPADLGMKEPRPELLGYGNLATCYVGGSPWYRYAIKVPRFADSARCEPERTAAAMLAREAAMYLYLHKLQVHAAWYCLRHRMQILLHMMRSNMNSSRMMQRYHTVTSLGHCSVPITCQQPTHGSLPCRAVSQQPA
jgi:hypothetical protein